MPSRDPAFSKMDVYSLTLSGVNGGTLTGPLACGCKEAGETCCGGTLGAVVKPSNFGRGPAAVFKGLAPPSLILHWCGHTPKSKLWCRFSSSLCVTDEPQHHSKTSRRKQSTVLGISNLPNLGPPNVSMMLHDPGYLVTSRPLLMLSGRA